MIPEKLLWNFVYWLTIKPRLAKLRRLLPEAKIYPTGSRYVCNPPVLTTDVDFLVYGQSDEKTRIVDAGYRHSSNYNFSPDSDFSSWRKGPVNLILTSNEEFADRHNAATHFCMTGNYRDKYERVLVYEAFRQKEFNAGFLVGSFNYETNNFLTQLSGPYGHTIYKAYRVKHGLTE